METDAVIGIFIIAGAVCVLTFLALWSRRRINRIDRRGYNTARNILRDLSDEG